MSTDFSIKPVGATVVAPIVHATSEAAQNAVATDLPPSQSVTAADAASRAGINSNAANASVSNQVFMDREAGAVVYQVVDNRTSQVLKQFPDEAALRRRAYFRALDLSKQGPTRRGATDRKA
jgi:uncharacterized FlaG/YvyC family protein